MKRTRLNYVDGIDLHDYARNMQGRKWGIYRARVYDNRDPLRAGRVKCEIPALTGYAGIGYDITNQTATAERPGHISPWCDPWFPSGAKMGKGDFDIPQVGDRVWVFCDLGDPNYMVYMGGWPRRGRSPNQQNKPPTQKAENRASWGARPAVGTRSPMVNPYRIVIHRSETPDQDTISDAERVRSIQDFHMDGQEWSDIGYHYLIGRDGTIFEGRPITEQGAHAGGANNVGSIGLCLLGTDSFTQAQIRSMEELISELKARFSISQNDILPHSDLADTDCPGDQLRAIATDFQSGERLIAYGERDDQEEIVPELSTLARGGGINPAAVPMAPPKQPHPSTGYPKGTGVISGLKTLDSFGIALVPDYENMIMEPPSPYATIYPWNKVLERNNLIIEMDDTPGAPRYHVMFIDKTGRKSYTEYHPDGKVVIRSADDKFEFHDGDLNIQTKGNVNWNVAGDFNLTVAGNKRTLVAGSRWDTVVGGWSQSIQGVFAQLMVGGEARNTLGNANIVHGGTHVWTLTGEATWTFLGKMLWSVTGLTTWNFLGGFTKIVTGISTEVFNGLANIAYNALTTITSFRVNIVNASKWFFSGDVQADDFDEH